MSVKDLENAVKYAPTLKVPTNAHVHLDMFCYRMAEVVFPAQVCAEFGLPCFPTSFKLVFNFRHTVKY